MPGPPFGWINETNPLGPPADNGNNTPLSAADLESFRAAIEAYNETFTTARISSDANLGGGSPSTTIAATQSAIQTYVANHSSSSSGGATGYINAQDPSITEGATILAGLGGTVNLSATITTLLNNAAGTAAVYFPPGVYGIGANGTNLGNNVGVKIPSNSHLILDPLAEFRCIAGSNVWGMLVNSGSGAAGNTNIVIEGGYINGNNDPADSNNAGKSNLVRMHAASPNFVTNYRIQNVRVANCAAQGTSIHNTRHGYILNNHVHTNGQDGIFVTGNADQLVIQGNLTYNNGDDDIAVASELPADTGGEYSKRVTVTGNVCGWAGGETGSGSGITVRGAEGVTVVGNTVNSPFGVGIAVGTNFQGATGIPCRDIVIANNTITNPGEFSIGDVAGGGKGIGIQLVNYAGCDQDVRNVIIEGNTVSNPRDSGISIRPHVDAINGIVDCVIRNNTVYWDQARKSWVTSYTGAQAPNADDFAYPTQVGLVVQPQVSGGQSGLFLDSVIEGNKVVNPPGVGFDVGTPSVQRLSFTNNTSKRSNVGSDVGINLNTAKDVTAIGNHAYDIKTPPTQTHGISAQNCTGSLILCHNDCTWGQGNLTAPMRYTDPGGSLGFLRLKDNPGFGDVANKG